VGVDIMRKEDVCTIIFFWKVGGNEGGRQVVRMIRRLLHHVRRVW
jgi:hypothetical protein